jgi:hypothetical protein
MSDLYDVEVFQAFMVDIVSATNYRRTKVSIQSLSYQDKITIPYRRSKFYTIGDAALAALKERGFNIVGWADAGPGKGYIFFSDSFKRLKK